MLVVYKRIYLAVMIDVLYDPADPQRTAIAGSRGVGGVTTIVVGLVLIAFGVSASAMISNSGFLDAL